MAKFENLRGFNTQYRTLVGSNSHMSVNNASGAGISIMDTDADGEMTALCLPFDVAERLALFMLDEAALFRAAMKARETKPTDSTGDKS